MYSNWEFLMSKTNICEPGCMWACPHYGGDIEYTPDMCPNTLDILARTVSVSVNPFWEPEEVNRMTDDLVAAADAM